MSKFVVGFALSAVVGIICAGVALFIFTTTGLTVVSTKSVVLFIFTIITLDAFRDFVKTFND